MFSKRPRYDYTFGVRMDLGADRMDPISIRPPAKLQVRETVLVERPGSLFGGFGRRDDGPLAALRARPGHMTKAPLAETRSENAPRLAPLDQGLRAFEVTLNAIWQRLSLVQRIGLSVFSSWFLIASGLWVVAALIAVVWFTRRKRPG